MKIIDKQFEGIRNLSFNKDLDYGCLFGVDEYYEKFKKYCQMSTRIAV